MDLRRGWWTPPLAPLHAQTVEERQIESLDMEPIVSLTDHDDLEAPMSLQAIDPGREIPISTEWTVPFGGTFFHVGVHNLPGRTARAVMRELAAFTARPADHLAHDLLAWLDGMPGTLLVFNHPMWDEKGVGPARHHDAVERFLCRNHMVLHAIEMNGLRPWEENERSIELAKAWRLPVVSGGDRHVLEPNANINLTNAVIFGEFADEIRSGHSEILVMPQYRQAYTTRIFHNMLDVLRPYEAHAMGWRDWEDRPFYRGADEVVRSLRECWGDAKPVAVRWFERGMRTLSTPVVQTALRFTGAERVSI